jgi:adenylate kinase
LAAETKAKFVIFMGPPGAGKGTQAQTVAGSIGLAHIATGDLFREAMAKQTELGKLAESYVKAGKYVPDEVTLGLVRDRLSQEDAAKGAILDGFPRTIDQAKGLDALLADKGTSVAKVVYLDVPQEALMARLTGRWTCRSCGAPYHQLFSPPKVAGVCDACGGELYQRPDDTAGTVLKRLEVYTTQTTPLIEYYSAKGLLVKVQGDKSPAEVRADILALLA